MKKNFFLLLTAVFCAVSAQAVELPDFAFTGQEITGFSIRPSFKHVTVSFSVQSSVDSYLKQESFSLKEVETKKYASEDPGGMYSGGFGTAVSSVFVGDRAYRNNIVKGYLDKQYLDVVKSYNSYYEKRVKGTKYEEEVNLVYAFALLETGSITQAFNILKRIAEGDGVLRTVAADRVCGYYMNTRAYEDMDIFVSGLKRISPYTLYSWLYSLTKLERYDRVVEVFDANSSIVAEDKRFYDFFINARYSQGGFDDVITAKGKASENTAGLIADACLVRQKTECARELYSMIPDSGMKRVIYGKIALMQGSIDLAEKALDSLKNDEDRLNLFFFYIGKNFPELDLEFVDRFSFDSKINSDYIKFYKGIYYLSKRDYFSAIRHIDGIVFNRDLINTAYYYRGLAYASIDASRAQRYLLKFIELSTDSQKLMVSRYMLGQLYYLDSRYDDSLMLVQSCGTDYCRILKAKIFLEKKDYASAWTNSDRVRGDEAALVRASILYNRKMYAEALAQLKLILNQDTQTQLLVMLSYLKLGDTKSAKAVFDRNSSDERFTDAYIEHLFLAGQYQEVLELTGSDRTTFRLERAKALFSLGKLKQAAEEFRSIITSGQHSFDAWYGLLSAYMAMGDRDSFAASAKEIADSAELYDKKDFLILQTAKMALDSKDTRLATMMLNSFFDSFTVSVYMKDARLLRGQLFRDTGRVDQCLLDADMMLKDGRSDEAMFLKGECLETTRKDEAVKIFEELTKGSERFKDLGYGKLAELYTEPQDIKKAVTYFKDKDSRLYYSGLERYFSKLNPSGLSAEKPFLDMLVAEGSPLFLPAAYYYSAVMSLNEGNHEESAMLFMKSYYLFPDSAYAQKSLSRAVASYEKLGRTEEAEIMKAKLKAVKK